MDALREVGIAVAAAVLLAPFAAAFARPRFVLRHYESFSAVLALLTTAICSFLIGRSSGARAAVAELAAAGDLQTPYRWVDAADAGVWLMSIPAGVLAYSLAVWWLARLSLESSDSPKDQGDPDN